MKRLIILVGLKGSGKSYIGSLMQERLGICFLRVEDIWRSVKKKRFSEQYYLEGFRLVEEEINNQFKTTDIVTIESTGVGKYFERFLSKLRTKYTLKLIRIVTSSHTCLRRIKSRDSSIHIPVSDNMIRQLNREALKVDLEFDIIIENENISDNEILLKVNEILK